MTGPITTASQRQVCRELRALRRSRKLTLQQVATELGCSITKVQRMETGRRGLKLNDVSTLLTLYEVPGAHREHLLSLITGLDDTRGWWQKPGARVPEQWRQAIAMEDEAVVIRDYNLGVVPVLLQNADYIRALLTAEYPDFDEPDLTHAISAHLTRQLILTRPNPPQVHCLIDESALHRPIGGPAVLAQQLRALTALATRPYVTMRLVPLNSRAHPGVLGSLTLLEFSDTQPMARRPGSEKFTDQDGIVARTRQDWSRIELAALPKDETKTLLRDYTRLL
ncbi:transcriptional regulator with XRE-family HTH domain [Crossiella equi]|uniref:Transcriptional regulator with XRE-family HTH domain n=1 Tax=Crossiella equi TaxID=130796 RepID=A0ABS5ADS2_9PSEU|nr:helix-turn-helix transcriptional regulator [Crossiella equi]MBP2474735.1 transcriptional regulator with XRE-family HTH domain [Crossiella equi]